VDMSLPYVSGFLFVRELPAYRELLARLRRSSPQLEPDVFLIDGSGMFHPRQCGSASHFGIEQDIRTIGVAKKLLSFEDFDSKAGDLVGNYDLPNLGDDVKIVGTRTGFVYGLALRTSAVSANKKQQKDISKKRVYISVGHRMSLDAAKSVVMRCCDVSGGSYIPEPIRIADLTGRAIERAWSDVQAAASPDTRQMIIDVCNLLDSKQRRTLLGTLEERNPSERMADIPSTELKRKRATIEELFEPFRRMHSSARIEDVRAALKLEKPWAIALEKGLLGSQSSGEAMRAVASSP